MGDHRRMGFGLERPVTWHKISADPYLNNNIDPDRPLADWYRLGVYHHETFAGIADSGPFLWDDRLEFRTYDLASDCAER